MVREQHIFTFPTHSNISVPAVFVDLVGTQVLVDHVLSYRNEVKLWTVELSVPSLAELAGKDLELVDGILVLIAQVGV